METAMNLSTLRQTWQTLAPYPLNITGVANHTLIDGYFYGRRRVELGIILIGYYCHVIPHRTAQM